MDNNYLHFADEEQETIKEPVEVIGEPYVDDSGTRHDNLLYYKAKNGCKIVCSDGSVYENAVVFKGSGLRFYETEEPIEENEEIENGTDSRNNM